MATEDGTFDFWELRAEMGIQVIGCIMTGDRVASMPGAGSMEKFIEALDFWLRKLDNFKEVLKFIHNLKIIKTKK